MQKINEGLSGRQWLVLVMTNAALRSTWVQAEVNSALHQVNIRRMRGVIPLMMTRCDEAHIPPLWAHLHRYDATKGYETARDGLLRAMGLSLPIAEDAPQSPHQPVERQRRFFPATLPQEWVRQKDQANLARLKTLDGLLSLSPQQFVDAVALMLKASGYRNIGYPEHGSIDIHCTTPDGRKAGVVCKAFRPGRLISKANLVSIGAMLGVSQDILKTDLVMVMVITTSSYTDDALEFARTNEDRMQVLDGQQLVAMMQRVQPQ